MDAKLKAYEKRFGVTNLKVAASARKDKRYVATFTTRDGWEHHVNFGQPGAQTWIDGAPSSKKQAYRARASRITNALGQYTYKMPGTANSLAYWLLWN